MHVVSITYLELYGYETHLYYTQVQGETGIGGRRWYDTVVYTTSEFSTQHITFYKGGASNYRSGMIKIKV